jgi:hypothetical protein
MVRMHSGTASTTKDMGAQPRKREQTRLPHCAPPDVNGRPPPAREQLGDPSVYTDTMGDESGMVRMHSGDGEHDEMDEKPVNSSVAVPNQVAKGIPLGTLRFDSERCPRGRGRGRLQRSPGREREQAPHVSRRVSDPRPHRVAPPPRTPAVLLRGARGHPVRRRDRPGSAGHLGGRPERPGAQVPHSDCATCRTRLLAD